MFRKDKNSNIFRPDFFLFAFSKRDANFWERPPRILLCPVSKKTNLKIEKAKKNTIQECLTLLMFVGECNRRSTNRWQFNQPFDLAPASACWLIVCQIARQHRHQHRHVVPVAVALASTGRFWPGHNFQLSLSRAPFVLAKSKCAPARFHSLFFLFILIFFGRCRQQLIAF